MPILRVALIGSIEGDEHAGLAQRVADAAGIALESPPGTTWVTIEHVASHRYAENGGAEPNLRSALVSVLQYELPPQAELAAQAMRLAAAIAEATARDADHVHIVFEPPAKGRIAFGGVLRS